MTATGGTLIAPADPAGRVPIPVDVAFPKPGLPDIGGEMTLPPLVPGLDVPSFDVHGFFFKAPFDVDGVQIPPIPGVIVIPGNIA
ncbi:MAG: hypothetical protein HYR72_17530 [Deltaproteobacteria bacterium]|nr:hypothetical protein [Deltaproteobacteria bacterium]MBI3386477.1 hypothetical protein [Deltaproteobacteria bacterium]